MVVIRGGSHFFHERYQLIEMKAATPAGTAQAENPLLWMPQINYCPLMRDKQTEPKNKKTMVEAYYSTIVSFFISLVLAVKKSVYQLFSLQNNQTQLE